MRSQHSRPPIGWLACVHPEGALYYRKPDDDLIFLSDADLTLPGLHEKVELFISLLKDYYRQAINLRRLVLPSDSPPLEVVIDADDFERENTWQYYIVDHASRHVLWLHTYSLEPRIRVAAASEARVGEYIDEDDLWSMAKLNVFVGHLLKVEYYQHLASYPHQNLSDDFLTETRSILVWSLTGELHNMWICLI